MKFKRADRLAGQYLLPELPGFVAMRGLVFSAPVEFLLRGFAFNPSGFDASEFCVETFIQPLYVPFDDVALTFAEQLGCWAIAEPGDESLVMGDVRATVKKRGLRFLEAFETVADVAERGPAVFRPASSRYMDEAVAYGFVLAGESERAEKLLEEIIQAKPEQTHGGSLATFERANAVLSALRTSAAEAAQLLTTWRDQTAEALRIREYVA